MITSQVGLMALPRSKVELLKEIIKLKGLIYVGTRGNTSGGTAIVGEAPGGNEERLRLPFVGASGKELGRILRDAGWPGGYLELEKGNSVFAPREIWYTNVFKVRPPGNDLTRLVEYGISTEMFVEAFLEELRTYRPTIIIATGNTSLGTLCPETRGKGGNARIGTYRGSLLRSSLLDWEHYVVPCHHPAFVLREWKERPVCTFCLERAREEFDYFLRTGNLQPLPRRHLKIQPEFGELRAYLVGCLQTARRRVSVDIELLYGWPIVYGLAISPSDAISFSLWDYPDHQIVELWRLLNEVLRSCPQIGQNYIGFDCTYHEWLGLEPNLRLFNSQIEDTMVLHHVLWPELPHKLEFLAMQYTREPYWKDEGKRWKSRDGIKPLMHYNALDAAVTYEVWLAMQAELAERSSYAVL